MAAAISRASICCQRLVALPAEEHDLVARLHVAEVGDVDGDHVHRHGADDRHAPAANQHVAAAAQPRVEAVGVAGRHDGDGPRRVGLKRQP